MSTSQPRARRRGGPRSKNGCGKCKARHIKCDETKPHCRRCLDVGKTCDGYSTAGPNNQAALALTASPIAAYGIPFRVPGSQQDRRLLHYYCVQGADDLSGHLSSEFWMRLVLQHSHDYIAVRQAVVALSCVHQYYVTAHDNSSLLPAEAMAHYNRAMRSLRKYMNAGIDNKEAVSAIVPLICSVIFFCFENTQGNTSAAIQHLNSGIAILARQKEAVLLVPDSRNSEHLDLLEQIIARFDLQASMFDDTRPLYKRMCPPVGSETAEINTFKTIDNAHADLTRLLSRLLQFLISNNELKFNLEHDLPEELKMEKRAIEEAYTNWDKKFDRFLRDQSILPKERSDYPSSCDSTETSHGEVDHPGHVLEAQVPIITTLRIYSNVFQLLLAANFPYDPSIFGGPSDSVNTHKLHIVLDLAESTPQVREAGSKRSLAVETGIIAPLFLIVMKCTDPIVFKRAFDLLSALSGRREGMFDSRVLAEIALRMMSQYQTPRGSAALECHPANDLDGTLIGLDGIAKNLGMIP
ncbi:hypothetical protein GGR51DRAFT_336984 [Nemania sp. FL0031]|nr:hypothetical protein GGR51DRAFT_336984 [Nemania sp. FL0031]